MFFKKLTESIGGKNTKKVEVADLVQKFKVKSHF